jgi:DedD protein
MGSVVLVLGAVVGLPLLFDSQPRPVAIDTPIVIPDRNQVAPLTAAVAPQTGTVKEPTPVQADPAPPETAAVAKSAVTNSAGLDPNEEVVSKTSKPEPKIDAKPEAKADAKLDGKDAPKSEQSVRSVVQVGAYAELAKAREVRAKLESAGFKTYTQEVDTKDGKRIRVRVGPFPSKEEAEKTAEKIRKLNLQTSVLKL